MEESEDILMEEKSLILSSIFKEMKESQIDPIQIICKDGKCINVSCLLLASISPVLAHLLKHADTQDFIVMIPDIEMSTVIYLLDNAISLNHEEPNKDKELWSLDGVFWKTGYFMKDTHVYNSNSINLNDTFTDTFKVELQSPESIDKECKSEPVVIKDCFINIERLSADKTLDYKRKRKVIHCPIKNNSTKVKFQRLIEDDPAYDPEDELSFYPKKKRLKKDKLSSSPENPKKKRTYCKRDDLSFQPSKQKRGLLDRLKKKDIPLTKQEIGRVFSVNEDSFDKGFINKQEKLKKDLQESTNLEDPRITWFKIHELNPKMYFISSLNNRPKMVCPLCSFHFPGTKLTTGKLFFNHLRRHRLKIARCSCMLTKGAEISEHIRLAHWCWVKCQHCEFILEPNYIKIHLFNRHMEDEMKTLKCDLCEIKHTRVDRHQSHMDLHFKQKEPTVCNICNIKYKSRSHWRHHEQVQHLKERLGCEQCYFTCTTDKQMKKHIEIRHNKLKDENCKQIYICDICAYTTKHKHNLDAHKLNNHDPDLIQCPMCPKMYTKYRLESHIKRTHIQLTVCTICGAKVKKIELHMNQHLPYEQCNHKCEPCQKGFHDKIKLKAHMMNVHLKERPYNCRYGCEFAYNDVSNRNSHEKKKHGQLFTKREQSDI